MAASGAKQTFNPMIAARATICIAATVIFWL